ncbi:hypothetical protein [Streptomyces sp. NRRL S-1022]|uniref:hypothetical protein n=1 Tax=Streptomyces sp. NRRL S-1022 TaxID=1463880 RepID=UPI00068ABFF4|nr:hypothetical protein [Streptomyces sp. NRRL S-1022]
MKLQRRTVLGATMVAALSTLAVVAQQPALAAPSPGHVSTASLNVCDLRSKIDEIKAWDTNGQYNIMVWKESAKGFAHFNGVVYQGQQNAQECGKAFPQSVNYFWAVFRDGEFDLQGDGGYRNWAFHGNWERQGNRVVFHTR